MKKIIIIFVILLLVCLFVFWLMRILTPNTVVDEHAPWILDKNESTNVYQIFPIKMSCDDEKTFDLNFMQISNSPGPGEIPVPVESTFAEVTFFGEEPLLIGMIDFRFGTYVFESSNAILKITGDIANMEINSERYTNCKNENFNLFDYQ